MGGSNSGRWGGRPTVEGGLSLDVGKLIREGLVVPGRPTSGTLRWTNTSTGEQIATMVFRADVDARGGALRLIYTSTVKSSGETRRSDDSIAVVSTAQPFGGRRFWFICPRTGARVLNIYLPDGAFSFASRAAYRLGYRCQRESPHDRTLNRAFKLRRGLGAGGGIGDPVFRPKGMHQATFERRLRKLRKVEAVCNLHLLGALQRLQARAGLDGFVR